MIHRCEHQVDNGDGWRIGLRQVLEDERHNPPLTEWLRAGDAP